jgi:hypothetical protein
MRAKLQDNPKSLGKGTEPERSPTSFVHIRYMYDTGKLENKRQENKTSCKPGTERKRESYALLM